MHAITADFPDLPRATRRPKNSLITFRPTAPTDDLFAINELRIDSRNSQARGSRQPGAIHVRLDDMPT